MSNIKVVGMLASHALLASCYGYEFTDGDEGLDILILLTELLDEMKERVVEELVDMGDIAVKLICILFEAGC